MSILKNMEVIFLVAAGAYLTVSGIANAGLPIDRAAPAAQVAASDVPMQTVTVSAKRLSAAEKAALI